MATIKVKNANNEWQSVAAAITKTIEVPANPVIEEIEITENGTYNAPNGVDGYNPVIVNVPTGGGADIPEEALTITGDCYYRFSYGGWNWFIDNYGNQITTNNITKAENMFYDNRTITNIPFSVNMTTDDKVSVKSMFYNCYKLKSIPVINNLKPMVISYMFSGCECVREIPEEVYSNWDWSYIDNLTSTSYGASANMFSYCRSLRTLPIAILEHGNPMVSYNNSIFYNLCSKCIALNEIVDLPNPHYNATWRYNAFGSSFSDAARLKRLTFKMPSNNPYVVNWKNQTIDLTYTGYISTGLYEISSYNSGISLDKEVKDNTTYQALKDDPDWFTLSLHYSRYNHDSAVETINSLPDTSAYLAANGGTNTIKFKGAAGYYTDGGAISNLTEEEIAVAAARGWTVSLV